MSENENVTCFDDKHNCKSEDFIAEKCSKWLMKSDPNEGESETVEVSSEITEETQGEFSDVCCYQQLVDDYKNTDLIDLEDGLTNVKLSNCKNVLIGNITKIYRPVQVEETVQTIVRNSVTNKIFINDIEQVTPASSLNIINRTGWSAQSPAGEINRLTGPVKLVIISHTASKSATTEEDNAHLVRLIQTFHIKSRKWNDIAYNFLIGCDGKVYEGRGWGAVGAHTLGYNQLGIGISFIGCFMNILPSESALSQAKALIMHGVEIGEIDEDYVLVGHCQCCPTESPGRALFNQIQTWELSKPTKRLSIVDRLNWLAQDPIGRINYLTAPAKFVIMCHTASKSSITQADNVLIVRLIQSNHVEGEQWSDISYNFLVGCDGKVYEGRGWGAEGDHTVGYNNLSVGIAFVGTFTHTLPSEPALHQAKVLIAHGVEIGAIDKDYVLVGHRQCITTESPGKALFDEIRTWDRWTDVLP
ncbi:hypothetical protein FQR65_LT00826 [Abscondita terminalis]|nr:hypothetical protein FQR65_LT00826 [Abscondita terminalis]